MTGSLRTDARRRPIAAAAGTGRLLGRVRVAALLTVLAALILPAGARAAAAPADLVGISNWSWPSAAENATLRQAGVRTLRLPLQWDWVERSPGVRSWGGLDADLANATASGASEILVVVNGCVQHVCGATRTAPQTDAERGAFQAYLADAVRRYGADGTFWRERPGLPRVRVSWQIWNEVNVGADWPNPTAAGYQQMLGESSRTVRTIDPSARIVAAGLAEFPAVASGQTLEQFLTGLEQDPAFRTSADAVAVHAYAADPAGTARILDATRAIMARAGDTRPIWITEMGWGTGGPPHAFSTDAAGQAARLRGSLDLVTGCRARWQVDRAIWFALEDVDPAALGEGDYWGVHTGLFDRSGAPKPAWDAFREYLGGAPLPAGRAEGCPLAGGDQSGAAEQTERAALQPPTVTVVEVPERVDPGASARVDFVTDMGDAGVAQCSYDGGPWAPCSTPFTAPGSANGVHGVQIRAVSPRGVVGSPASATWQVAPAPPPTLPGTTSPSSAPARAAAGITQAVSRRAATIRRAKLQRCKRSKARSSCRRRVLAQSKRLSRVRAAGPTARAAAPTAPARTAERAAVRR